MAEIGDRAEKATVDAALEESDASVIKISGELDLASVPGIESDIEPIIAAAPERLVFDLSGVAFMDSSGIAMLLRAAKRVARIEVRTPSAAVQLIIEATGLAEVLHVEL
jgi:anti-sigma B factor antagonist